jgi:hypothetical protein
MPLSDTESWLEQTLDIVFSKGKIQGDGSAAFVELNIPARSDGSAYTVDGLASDQKVLLAEVLEAVRDFCEQKISNDGWAGRVEADRFGLCREREKYMDKHTREYDT